MPLSVRACCSVVVNAPLQEAFEKFIDFPRWGLWMTSIWAPVSGPSRPLADGDRFTVAVVSGRVVLRTPVSVLRVLHGRECTWGGGMRGVMHAEHSFFFEEVDDSHTRIRSDEVFSGLLVGIPPLGQRVQREIQRIGEGQIGSFAAWMNGREA